MRIPPFYQRPIWQRFFAGIAIGVIVSWLIFLYMYGELQEEQTKLIRKQQDDINDLTRKVEIWQEEYKVLNKKNEQQLTIQEINIKLINGDKYNLDKLSILEIEKRIKEDASMMNAKDLETVFKSKDVLKKMIENKTVKINERRYKLEVVEIVIFTTLSIKIEIHLDG